MDLTRALMLVFFVTCLFSMTHAKTIRLTFDERLPSKFFFVDNFCFDNTGGDAGTVSWSITSGDGDNLEGVSLVFFDDQDDSWPAIERTMGSTTCEDRLNSTQFDVKAVFPLQYNRAATVDVSQSTRQWYWYIVLASCARSSLELRKSFTIDITFSNPGGFFDKQFSKDLQSILPMYMFGFIPIYFVLGIILLVNIILLVKRGIFHYIIRLFAFSFYVYAASLVLSWIHYFKYAFDGIGLYWMDDIGLVWRMESEIVFITILYLIASGWTITYTYVRYRFVLLGIFIGLNILYLLVFIWSQLIVSRWSILYLFETPPGMILAALRLPMLVYFWFSIALTLKQEPKAKTKVFYYIFGSFYSLWFLLLPFSVFLSLVLPPYARAKTLIGVDICLQTVFFIVMLGLLWFSNAPSLFQYIHLNEVTQTEEQKVEDENEKKGLVASEEPRSDSKPSTPSVDGSHKDTSRVSLFSTLQAHSDNL